MASKEKKKVKKKFEILHLRPDSYQSTFNQGIPSMSDRATKRVIAPYVSIIRKGVKPPPPALKPIPSLTHLIGKKPSLLIRKISQFLLDTVDLTSLLNDTATCMKAFTKATGTIFFFV